MRSRLLVYCLCLLLAAASFKETIALEKGENVISWTDCVKITLRNNPELKSSRESVHQKKYSKGIARSSMLPQVSAGVSGSKSADEDNNYTAEKRYSYSLSAKQLIFDGFKSYYDLRGAKSDIESAKRSYDVTSVSVRYDLRKAFITLQEAQSMIKIRKGILKRRKHVMDLVRMKYRSGTEHRGSFYSARADYVQAEANLKSAVRAVTQARTNLLCLMGLDLSGKVSIKEEGSLAMAYMEKPDFNSIISDHPSMRKYRADVKSAEYALQSAKLAFSPQIYGSASVGRSGDSMSNMSGNWSLGFEFTAPLFEGGETWYGYKKAQSVYRQAKYEEKKMRDDLVQTMEEAWNSLMDSIDDVKVKKSSLQAAQERSMIGEKQYSIGTLTFDNWTIIENNLASAEKLYIEARANALTAEAQWIQATGGSLEYKIR